MFPSPYGVSFILIQSDVVPGINITNYEFPSLYGVSFILMFKEAALSFLEGVSVSLRSIIHSYEIEEMYNNTNKLAFPSPYGVIFILTNEK